MDKTNKTRITAANMGLASREVTCLNSSAVFQINFGAGLTVLCPEIPHERQAQKRYMILQNRKIMKKRLLKFASILFFESVAYEQINCDVKNETDYGYDKSELILIN